MGAVVQIDALRARYRLSHAQRSQRPGLDRALREVASSRLGEAVEAAGLPAGVIVCIRRLNVPVHLDPAAREDEWADAWVTALARAVAQASRAPSRRPDVVVYRSRAAARLDALLSLPGGDLRRAWAWRQAGLLPKEGPSAPEAVRLGLVQSWLGAAETIVPTMAAAFARGALPALWTTLSPQMWRALAGAACRAHGARATKSDAQVGLRGRGARREFELRGAQARLRAASIRSRSTMWRAVEYDAQRLGQAQSAATGAHALVSLLTLVALEGAPAIASEPPERLDEVVEALLVELAPRLGARGRDVEAAALQGAREARPERAGQASDGDAASETGADRSARSAGPEGTDPADAADPTDPADPTDRRSEAQARARALEAAEQVRFERLDVSGETEEAGVLFLLRPLVGLGFVGAALEQASGRGLHLQEVLHFFVRRLRPVAPADPAALAFCGLAPDAAPPTEAPLDEALEGWADAWIDRLAAWAQATFEGAEYGEDALEWVSRRPARIVEVVGKLSVRLSLRAVCTDIRKAGLDLDPGWIPWLGVTMEFVYE